MDYNCHVCETEFQQEADFTKHMNSHKKKIYTCSICKTKFYRKATFTKHINRHKKKVYACSVCKSKFYQKIDLSTHINQHKDQVYQCSVCKNKFHRKIDLSIHMKCHFKKVNKCSVCEREFHNKSALAQHMVTHSEKKDDKSSAHERERQWKLVLLKQRNHHTKRKVSKCSNCEVVYSDDRDLSRHMIYEDSQCKEIFAEKNNSSPQIVSYNIGCEVCERVFTQPLHLTSHMMSHSCRNDFECYVCGEKHFSRSKLVVHLIDHTNGAYYIACEICGEFVEGPHMVAHTDSHKEKHVERVKDACGEISTAINNIDYGCMRKDGNCDKDCFSITDEEEEEEKEGDFGNDNVDIKMEGEHAGKDPIVMVKGNKDHLIVNKEDGDLVVFEEEDKNNVISNRDLDHAIGKEGRNRIVIVKEGEDPVGILKEGKDPVGILKEGKEPVGILKEGEDSVGILKEGKDHIVIDKEGSRDHIDIKKENKDSMVIVKGEKDVIVIDGVYKGDSLLLTGELDGDPVRDPLSVDKEDVASERDLIDSVQNNSCEWSFKCKECGESFRCQPALDQHRIVHTDNRIKCEICGCKFAYVLSLSKHMRNKHLR